jgi:hypothetical protein
MSSSYAGGCLDRFVYWPVAIALVSLDEQAPACVAIYLLLYDHSGDARELSDKGRRMNFLAAALRCRRTTYRSVSLHAAPGRVNKKPC